MGSLAKRIFIFLLGVPAIAAAVLLLPQFNHLAFNLLVVVFSSLGAVELSAMLATKNLHISKAKAAFLGALLPATVTVVATVAAVYDYDRSGSIATYVAYHPLGFIFAVATAGIIFLLVSNVFCRGEKLENFANEMVAGFSVLMYPGMLLSWLVLLSSSYSSGILILGFLVMVFLGDSLAWLTGMLFGKSNRGIVPASPNKSIAGFAGGILGPVLVGIAMEYFLPGFFGHESIIYSAVLGLVTGCAAILGDLCESAIKRSCGVKDSGTLMMGRGGVLDSIDSIAMAAPVFYCFVTWG